MKRYPTWAKPILAAIAALYVTLVQAQPYPSSPIKIIVPFAAGASNDAMGRLVARELSKQWGRENVVENITGAGGNVGASTAARSAPNGYTLIAGSIGTHAVNQFLFSKMPYDTQRDFAPITLIAEVGLLVVVHPSLKVSSIPELIAYAQAHPGELNFASGGVGSSQHLATELFMYMTKTKMTHVPYQGSAGSISDLLGGRIQVMFADLPLVLSHVQAGTLRPIGFAGERRSPAMPEVPTVDESGVKGYRATAWYGLFAPAGTPDEITGKLNEAVTGALRTPDVQAYLLKLGAEPRPMSIAEFMRFQKNEADRWGTLIKQIGLKID